MRRIPHRFLAVTLWGVLAAGDGHSAPATTAPEAPYELQVFAVMKPSAEPSEGVTKVTLQIRTTVGSPPTIANKILLKSVDVATGETYWVRNFINIQLTDVVLPTNEVLKQCSFDFTDLQRRMPLTAQVSVKTEDSTKGEVLRANTLVLLSPDLQIASIDAPQSVGVLQPADIRVTILEHNGDLGARCDVLLLDETGRELDRITGLLVGPAGASTAVLSVRFSTIGDHHLTTRITNSDPEETDTSNNERSVSISVTSVTVRSEWWAEYRDYRLDDYYSFTEVKQPTGSWHTEFENHGSAEYAYVTARAPVPLAWPWNFTGTLRLDGTDRVSISRNAIMPDTATGDPSSGGAFLGTYRSFDPDAQADIQIIVYYSGQDDGLSYSLAELHQLATDYVQYSSGYYNNWYGSTYNWSSSGLIREGSFLHATGSLQGLVGLSSEAGSFGGWTDVLNLSPFADHTTSGGSSSRYDASGARIDTTYSSTIDEEGFSVFGYGQFIP